MEPDSTFATVDQYEARYGPVADRGRLAETLSDATRLIAAECAAVGIDTSAPEMADALMQACRSVAARAMQALDAGAPLGVTQFSQGAGGFSESWSMANPSAEVYLTKTDRAMLGLSRQRIGTIAAEVAHERP